MMITPKASEYLRKIVDGAGLKPGTAKMTAIYSIIDLIGDDVLNGLLEALKKDYEDAIKVIEHAKHIKQSISQMESDYRVSQYRLKESREEHERILEDIKDFQNNRRRKCALDVEHIRELMAGCREEEISKVVAYKVAIDVASEYSAGKGSEYTIQQIIRSASNVAGDWKQLQAEAAGEKTEGKKEKQKAL